MTKAKEPFGQSPDPTGLASDDQREKDKGEALGLDEAGGFGQDSHMVQGGDTRAE